jgi:hypothetical protein
MLYKGMLINAKYPQELDIIPFDKITRWEFPFFSGFQYDYISNEMIEVALRSPQLTNIDINIDWEDDEYLEELSDDTVELSDDMKHAYRIAALINAFKNGASVNPVSIDTFVMDKCCLCIYNGHHRIRALQYQLFDFFPAYCSGDVDEIKKIRMKNFNYKKYTGA